MNFEETANKFRIFLIEKNSKNCELSLRLFKSHLNIKTNANSQVSYIDKSLFDVSVIENRQN